MAQINVTIAGRTYRMACADGEEEHLMGLAARLDHRIDELRGSFGEIGDGRITVMAALTIADQMVEAERKIMRLEAEIDRLHGEQAGFDAKTAAMAETLAETLNEAAARVERIVHGLNAAQRE
jgi:cell division protein ZapA